MPLLEKKEQKNVRGLVSAPDVCTEETMAAPRPEARWTDHDERFNTYTNPPGSFGQVFLLESSTS